LANTVKLNTSVTPTTIPWLFARYRGAWDFVLLKHKSEIKIYVDT